MLELVFSIYCILISLFMFYQSYAKVFTDKLPYISLSGGSSESVLVVVLANISAKWGLIFGVLGIVFIVISCLFRLRDKSNEIETFKMLIIITIVLTIVGVGCLL